ncbi:MAG: hypothetical protein QM817_17190 [Archangium sp.]
MSRWATIIALIINAYLLGAMVMFGAVTYPQFGAVDRSAFGPLYQSFNSRIGLAVVPWEFVAFLATLALYVFRDELQLGVLHAVVALGVAYFAITFAWHLPAHRSLAAGDNSDLSSLLTSQWARTVVQLLRVAALAWLLRPTAAAPSA